MRAFSRAAASVAVTLLTAGTLAACGGDDGGSAATTTEQDGGPGGGTRLEVLAKDSLAFDRGEYTIEAGTIDVLYVNDGSLPHTLLIDDVDDFKLSVSGGGSEDEGEVELAPGEYELYCDVPGHRGAGMEATLTVE